MTSRMKPDAQASGGARALKDDVFQAAANAAVAAGGVHSAGSGNAKTGGAGCRVAPASWIDRQIGQSAS